MTRRSRAACSPREAIDLMIAHGLTARRVGAPPRADASARSRPAEQVRAALTGSPGAPAGLSWTPMSGSSRRRAPGWLRWSGRRACCGRSSARVWSRATLLELGCGWERGRVIIPIRNGDGELRGVLRYAPIA